MMTSDDGSLFDIAPHTWTFKGCFGLGMVWARVPTGRFDVILFGISCMIIHPRRSRRQTSRLRQVPSFLNKKFTGQVDQ